MKDMVGDLITKIKNKMDVDVSICSPEIKEVLEESYIEGMGSGMNEKQYNILRLMRKRDINKLSLREIGKLVDIPHPQSVKHHLLAMVSDGKINVIDGEYKLKE